MANDNIITANELRKILNYNLATGIFIWISKVNSNALPGYCAGCLNSQKYLVIRINKKLYLAHRLAWLYVYGAWPKDQIDHINLDKSDNRIDNLREATQWQNEGNVSIRRDNTSGIKGVSWYKRDRKWRANIQINGKQKNLGFFDNIESAAFAYADAALERFGEFARLK